jgi:hypothetical protein
MEFHKKIKYYLVSSLRSGFDLIFFAISRELDQQTWNLESLETNSWDLKWVEMQIITSMSIVYFHFSCHISVFKILSFDWFKGEKWLSRYFWIWTSYLKFALAYYSNFKKLLKIQSRLGNPMTQFSLQHIGEGNIFLII